MFAMNDVSNKVAYAYSKQEAFVSVAVAFVLAGFAFADLEMGDPRDLVDEAILLLGGLGILVLAFRFRDLRRINRHALAITGVVLLVTLLASVLLETGDERLDDQGLSVALGLVVLSYPWPLNRGKTSLFSPSQVRELSDNRTLAMGSLLTLWFSVWNWLPGGSFPLSSGLPGGWEKVVALGNVVVAILALILLVYYLATENSSRLRVGLLTGFGLLSLASLGLVLEEARHSVVIDSDLLRLLFAASTLLTTFLLSRSLNQGRTIVTHRA
jgi:hypothetical protein